MNFTKIRLVGFTPIDLPTFDAKPSDNYIFKGADGFGPPEIDVSVSPTLHQGGVYQERQPQNREVVVRVGLNPDYGQNQTAEQLRDTLYGLLTPGYSDLVTVKVMNGVNVLCVTEGSVKKMEAALFSKEPEVQITIECLHPFLYAPEEVVYVPPTKGSFTVPNVGSAHTGFEMELNITVARSSLIVTKPINGDFMRFDYAFLAGDKLTFDTRPGQKAVQLTRGVTTTNIIYSRSTDSKWLMLHRGDNAFTVNTTNFDWGQITFTPRYWGV